MTLSRRVFLGASAATGVLVATGCSVVNPAPEWDTILGRLRYRLPSNKVLKISGSPNRLEVVDDAGALHTWKSGTWSDGEVAPDTIDSLVPFEVDTFDLGNIRELLSEYDATDLVARQEKTYLQPVLTMINSSRPDDRINFITGMTEVPTYDYAEPEGVESAVASLAAAAMIPPVSVSLAGQADGEDAVFFFGLRENRPIYLYRRSNMPVQWVGEEPGQDYQGLPSFDLGSADPGALANAMNQLRERADGGDLASPAATLYSYEGQTTLAVECTYDGQPQSVVAGPDGALPEEFLSGH